MNREIKFRVREIINSVDSLKWSYFTLGDLACSNFSTNHKEFFGESWTQYTGLEDKNGKEIYEGDIIKCYDFGITAIGIVVYKIDSFQIDWIKNGTRFNNYISVRIDKIEVIGNIFENPELLNKQQEGK